MSELFQCRTQHCVCRDRRSGCRRVLIRGFNAARSIVCVETASTTLTSCRLRGFNAARSIVCVETEAIRQFVHKTKLFQCRTQHCVCWDMIRNTKCVEIYVRFNAARSIVCVGTSFQRVE